MKRCLQLVAPFLLALPLWAGEVIDRIVAIVDSRAIMQSEWDDALRYEALAEGRALQVSSGQVRQAVLDRLIDQELLRQQMQETDLLESDSPEVRERVAEIRRQYPEASSDAGWRALLDRYGLTADEVAERVAAQLSLLGFVEQRLRPSVRVDTVSIETYYREKYLPELRKAGGREVPLAEVSSRIEEILVQQRMDELLSAWLQNLRLQSQIRTAAAPSPQSQSAEVR
jgi:hypothetical protein